MLHRYIGDRAFYRRVLAIVIPIIIQTAITNFVSLLDNIMVGQIGTTPMSGVSVVNQLIFIFNLTIFGASSGAGIFTAQFHGSQDHVGVRHTFRFKLMTALAISGISILIFLTAGPRLIGLYLTGEGNAQDAEEILGYGLQYLHIMLWGLVPFALSDAYSTTLRETGETVIPMIGGTLSVFVNLCLNYVLIFGHFGAPAMGVKGAALATVISRYVELGFVAAWVHSHPEKKPFIRGAYRSLYVPARLLRAITFKGMPLLINEFFWSVAMALLNQSYSTCSLDVVPALNISTTLVNVGSVVYLSMGSAVGILMGQMLGAGLEEPEVRDSNRKLIALSVSSGVVFGILMAMLSGLFPMIYNTTDSVRRLSTQLICVAAFMLPFNSYLNATYFTLRSGGQVAVTILFDCCFVWAVSVPVAYVLSRFTDMSILPLFIICQALDFIKCALGAWMLKQGKWIQNLTH